MITCSVPPTIAHADIVHNANVSDIPFIINPQVTYKCKRGFTFPGMLYTLHVNCTLEPGSVEGRYVTNKTCEGNLAMNLLHEKSDMFNIFQTHLYMYHLKLELF